MPEEGVEWKPHAKIIRFEESLRLCRILCEMGIRRIKLTGGEPLVRLGMEGFIRELRKTPGLEQITLTTNGLLLPELLDHLGDQAVSLIAAVNISLNSLDPGTFSSMARRAMLEKAMEGVDRARAAGIPIKLNCVPVRGYNENDLIPLARRTEYWVKAVRFIELMPMGAASGLVGIPKAEILDLLNHHFGPLEPDPAPMGNGPAEYYSILGFKGKIGFISAMSESFCHCCNRLRLNADGRLRACLASELEVDLLALLRSGADDGAIKEAIKQLVTSKPKAHDFIGSTRNGPWSDNGQGERPYQWPEGMYRIGG
jgi:cyclic pyranopterin phosphate synthase